MGRIWAGREDLYGSLPMLSTDRAPVITQYFLFILLSGFRKRRWFFEDGWLVLEAF